VRYADGRTTPNRTSHQSVPGLDNCIAARLRAKHKVRRRKGGIFHSRALCGHFGLVRLSRLGHDVPWVKAGSFVRERDARDLPVGIDERGAETEPR
jgi:hypothetical protein